ncbi:hypothetical protein [Bosea sp. (in: a-proteobacteria)]|uniref:hypothetical protein n=1 Tax=Bosea sp. (in: a-proteobacteria) TaxID=1871050 RepID=UPI002B49C151|nr:hypothetical protein [Bosea sp. (in: a-proteobacteria)]WRH56688.1 MAG: hypothetical protein RSE11_16800 [Bosea sp. (in: a-proteobacteria)]
MTERRQIWLIVGACLVVYAAVMFGFSAAIREPVKWGVDWLISMLGQGGTGILFGAFVVFAFAVGFWPDKDYVPPPQPEFPRWFRWSRAIYLSVLGVAMVALVAVMVAMG